MLKQDEASLSEEEFAQVKKAVALQITFYGLIDELKEFLNEIGLNGGCLDQGIQKAKEVFWQRMKEDYSLDKVVVLAVNAGEVQALYCLSSRENCPSQGDWGQFTCGAIHALVEEIDVNGMLDAGTEAYRAYIKNRTDCLMQGTELVSVFSSENPSDIIRTLNQCFLGIDIGPEEATQLYDAATAYVAAHYDDPYDQGRATVFVLSIVSPFGKIKQLSKAFKLKLLDKLKKLGSPADELAKLRRAIEAEDIEDIRVAIGAAARGSVNNLSAKSKKILESWPDDVYNKFYDEVASTELWDNTFKNAANQDGLVEAWKAIKYNGDADLAKLATNLDELDLVAKNLDKIEAAGGYKAWKALKDIVRGVSKKSFQNSFTAPEKISNQAWVFFKNESWKELESLFKANNINDGWPPNRGFIGYSENPMKVKSTFDRYGGYVDKVDGVFIDKGSFVSPLGASFESRALPLETINKPYKRYRVIKEIPSVKSGKTIPWFNQPGKGLQYELPESIEDLLKGGYIEEID